MHPYNTGITLRTIRIKNQIAEIRVGATLLMDSIPSDEEQETHTKAAALIQAITEKPSSRHQTEASSKTANLPPKYSTIP
jgi:anthranilate/para-aminobenzoate synthase component I